MSECTTNSEIAYKLSLTSDIFDSPKISREEQHHHDKAGDEGVREPTAEHIHRNGRTPEYQVEEHDIRVTASQYKYIEFQTIHTI
jgi:hypothetical protein